MKPTGISNYVINRRPYRHGFSLTELAIVIGVIGLVIGSIWTVATQAWESAHQQQLKSDIAILVKNVRAYYVSQGGTGAAVMLVPQIAALSPSPIPGDMIRTGGGCTSVCVDHPWASTAATAGTSGSLNLCGWNPDPTVTTSCATGVTGSQFFAVELIGMPQGACVKVALNNSGADGALGLYDVVINGTSILNGAGVTHQFPVKETDAATLCTAGATVDFIYRLMTPQSG